jgi:multiple sugar transport system permease protein
MSTRNIIERITERRLPRAERGWIKQLRNWSYLFPLGAFYVPFMIIPSVGLFVISLFAGSRLANLEFVGFQNYVSLANGGILFRAIKHNLIYTGGNTILTVGGGLAIALGIHASYKRLRKYLRFVYMLPFAMMTVGVAFIWRFMYHPRVGALNIILSEINQSFANILWLGDGDIVMFSIIIVGVWQSIGFYTTIWMVGLLNIDETYYEAAKLDGASRWAQFRHITLPLLKPIGVFLLLVSLIGSLKLFAYVWAMTQGGPAYNSEVLVTYMFKLGFKQTNMGQAAAVGVVLFLLILVVTLLTTRVVGLDTDYDV